MLTQNLIVRSKPIDPRKRSCVLSSFRPRRRGSSPYLGYPVTRFMKKPHPLGAPLGSDEALDCIRAIFAATVDRDCSISLEAAFRLIDKVLLKSAPLRQPSMVHSSDDTPSLR